MSSGSAHTVQLQAWLDRMRAGDRAAREELLASVHARMERLARKMLRGFPGVRRWAETGDVLQNAVLRLLRALDEVRPASVREFFALAATQMRRELLDLARHFHGPQGLGAHHASVAPDDAEAAGGSTLAEDLDRWSRFHEEVERLPSEEREVVGLIFYHGWSQSEVAELFGITVRTVQRRWQSALATLHQRLGGAQLEG